MTAISVDIITSLPFLVLLGFIVTTYVALSIIKMKKKRKMFYDIPGPKDFHWLDGNLHKKKLTTCAKSGHSFEAFEHVSLCTLDIILRCAFSYETDCQTRGNCIGQHFALNEEKVVIARILQKFRLSLDSNHTVKKKISAVMRSENGIRLNLSLMTKYGQNGS